MFLVDRFGGLNGFHFHDELVVDDEIPVANWDRQLTFDVQPTTSEFVRQHPLVDGLEQPWAPSFVHLEGRIDDAFRYARFPSSHLPFASFAPLREMKTP